jgi:sec-independent protein translocase protein TatB
MNLGMSEMIFIFIAALILVGPKKMPEIMRQVGKWMAEFKRASNEFKWQIEAEMRNLELEAERSKQTILPPAVPPQGTIANGAVIEAQPALNAASVEGAPAEPDPAELGSAEPGPAEPGHAGPNAAEEIPPVSAASAKSVDA